MKNQFIFLVGLSLFGLSFAGCQPKNSVSEINPNSIVTTPQPTVKPNLPTGWHLYSAADFSIAAPSDYNQNDKSSSTSMIVLEYGNISLTVQQGSTKSSLGNHKTVIAMINGQEIQGIESWAGSTVDIIYPMTHNEKLYSIKFHITEADVDQVNDMLADINKILITFKFTN